MTWRSKLQVIKIDHLDHFRFKDYYWITASDTSTGCANKEKAIAFKNKNYNFVIYPGDVIDFCYSGITIMDVFDFGNCSVVGMKTL